MPQLTRDDAQFAQRRRLLQCGKIHIFIQRVEPALIAQFGMERGDASGDAGWKIGERASTFATVSAQHIAGTSTATDLASKGAA